MKILIDTNVVLDAIADRKPFNKNAQRIFLLAAREKLEVFLTANCMTDVYYVTRKYLTDTDAREALRKLFQIFTVIDVRGTDCETALDLPMQDYEDAVVFICARKAGVEYIITRDNEFLKAKSTPPTISPTDFLKLFKE